jgi:hypothetical protein
VITPGRIVVHKDKAIPVTVLEVFRSLSALLPWKYYWHSFVLEAESIAGLYAAERIM